MNPDQSYSFNVVELKFGEVPLETVRKGVRVTLRVWVWPSYRAKNGRNGAAAMSREAPFRAPLGLFGQSLQRLSEKVLSSVPKVDSDVMRKAKCVEKSLRG